jgi:hypothetical protein
MRETTKGREKIINKKNDIIKIVSIELYTSLKQLYVHVLLCCDEVAHASNGKI